MDQVNGSYTFLPAGDQDWYRLMLEPNGLQTAITVRGTAGLDLRTSISRDDGTPLAEIASPAISTTLAPDITGGVILRVENRAPQIADGESYGIEVRQSLPPEPIATATDAALPTPDALENNWNPATAAPIGVGVVYDLNFTCPVPWGCAGGDHDYVQLPVKAGMPYLIATFDLGPGVDTVLDLFWGDPDQPLATNDDARPGSSFLSVLRWVAPADGVAILRVAPRTGRLQPRVDDPKASSYRLAVALAGSDLAQQLEERIATQTNAPTPTPSPARPAAAAASAAPAAPSVAPTTLPVSSDAPTGTAVVRVASATLRAGPSPAADVIQELPAEAIVTLLGQASGAWVRVQPAGGVVPGWLRGADLARLPDTTATVTAPATTPASNPPAPTATATVRPEAVPLVVTPLDPLPPPIAPPPAQRVAIAVTVRVGTTATDAQRNQPLPTPRPTDFSPLESLRVQLVTAFGDALAEGRTDATGQVALSAAAEPGAVLFVQLPAVGLRLPVDPAQAMLTIALPEESPR
ncbi:SH3 domain-containing protein [Chloroflexales bacterium ZM16-3]|nr:SH3 domain-containing protein [Chloroflexales bacterium ZM16-3]